MRSRMHQPSHTKLRFEPLESRQMLTGTVAVALSGGTVTLTGSGAGNGVNVTDNGTALSVTGLNYDGGATAVTGTTTPIANTSITKGIKINLNGGATYLQIGTTTALSPLPGNLTVDLGKGNNVFYSFNSSVAGNACIVTGYGNDLATLLGLKVGGTLAVDTGAGNDYVVASLNGTHVTTAIDAYIAQESLIGDTALGTYFGANGGVGTIVAATVAANATGSSSLAAKDAAFATGLGNDNATVENATVKGLLAVDLGPGSDTLNFGANTAVKKAILVGGLIGTHTLNTPGTIVAHNVLFGNPTVLGFQKFGDFV